MINTLLTILAVATPQDTLRLTPGTALDAAERASLMVRGADARSRAARAAVGVSTAWPNPMMSVAAENLGAQAAVTGRTGLAGTEGAVVLTGWLPLGGDRAASIRAARASADGGSATLQATIQAARLEALFALASWVRDGRIAANAAEEAEQLERFASSMSRRAEEGRTAGGEAARARIEAGLARSRAARRAATAELSASELRRSLGVSIETVVVLETAACGAEPRERTEVPELAALRADAAAAAASLSLSRARAIPDLLPQVGFRRTAGASGLHLGIGLELPLFNAGRAATRVARAEVDLAEARLEEASRRIAAERAGARRAAELLDAALARFDVAWRDDLERTITAAEARYDAGEGTLAELLDARRARLNALDELETGRAELRAARARLARSSGMPIDGTLFCDDLPGESQ